MDAQVDLGVQHARVRAQAVDEVPGCARIEPALRADHVRAQRHAPQVADAQALAVAGAVEQAHLWHRRDGINVAPAWRLGTGRGVVIAVLDTGITAHTDLGANLVAGYDFITDVFTANDGDGRDSDPSDPGDWIIANECGGLHPGVDSSWHGTHVAGTIAAVTNNAKGVAGVAFGAKVQPLRVIGKCGGVNSDIADAIVWASGGTVAGAVSESAIAAATSGGHTARWRMGTMTDPPW